MSSENFPRGGKKRPSSNNVSEILEPKKRKKESKTKRNKKNQETLTTQTNSNFLTDASLLTMRLVNTKMNILGRVFQIFSLKVLVHLPGSLTAKVSITNICRAYSNKIQEMTTDDNADTSDFKTLKEMFKPGDYVVCHVVEKDNDSRINIVCSLSPHDVNVNVNPSALKVGSTLVCSVSSVEENIYAIETGITNVRAFLKKDNTDDRKYYMGSQLTCYITEIKQVDNIYNVHLSRKPKHEKKEVQASQPLDNIVPNSRLSLTVNRILPSGLEVQYDSDKLGYINQTHLPRLVKSYTEGEKFLGTLLYVTPISKFPHFSALSFAPETQIYEKGDIIEEASVVAHHDGGIYLTTPNNVLCYVSNKRTAVEFSKVKKVFAPQSKHKCRVLAYSSLDRFYTCSMEKHILNKKYFTISDFKVGKVYPVTIKSIDKDNWVYISCHDISGTIQPMEVRDQNQQFIPKVGATVDAKVMSHDLKNKRLFFSTRSSIVNTNHLVLKNAEEAELGQTYLLRIIGPRQGGLLVAIFGGAKGFLPHENLLKEKSEQNLFGRAVAIDKEKNRVMLHQVDPREMLSQVELKKLEKLRQFQIGSEVEGVVIDSSLEGIQVELPGGEVALLPPGHVVPCLSLGSVICQKTELGTKIKAIVFANYPILVLTTSVLPPGELKFEDLRRGDMFPCSLHSIDDNDALKVHAIVPCDNFSGKAWTYFSNEKEFKEKFYPFEIKIARVDRVYRSPPIIRLYTGFNLVWAKSPNQLMSAVDLLALYLNKVHEFSNMPCFKDKPISKIKIGQKVQGKVKETTENGLILELADGVLATVGKEHFKSSYKVGQKLTVSILWINYEFETVVATALPHFISKISKKVLDKSVIEKAELLWGIVVYVHKWFVIVMLKGKGNHSLAMLPVRNHLNDVNPDLRPYFVHRKVRCFGVLHQYEAKLQMSICVLKSRFEDSKNESEGSSEKENGEQEVKVKIEDVKEEIE